ncbi:MAG: anthranilate synthase component I family protein [Thermoanaerobaculia bacterium]|nr:anthranilate synthase component I family protein [Thermoanaerobaculia bacterium]
MSPDIAIRPLPASLRVGRARLASLIGRPGSALLEGWIDEGEAWQLVLPWPEEIREVRDVAPEAWRELLRTISAGPVKELPATEAPFLGGWVGFVSYEPGAAHEAAPARADSVAEPFAWFARHSAGLAIRGGTAFVFAPEHEIRDRTLEVETLLRKATEPEAAIGVAPGNPIDDSLGGGGYGEGVAAIRRMIRDGDVYQVNLTRRLTVRASLDPRAVYLALTRDGIPRCSALLAGDDWSIASASPEVFLRHDRRLGVAESRPIKGTIRRRGDDDAEIARLLGSTKDVAEHLMIVDLVRNDLGKVALAGKVSVSHYLTVRTIPHLHHLESTVRAEELGDTTVARLFDALFPGGSITGAPKRAAVAAIRGLEPCARGVYTGAIGFVGANGMSEFSVAIRTAVITASETRYHAGGGIVWDSDARAEDDESRAKSVGFFHALGLEEME